MWDCSTGHRLRQLFFAYNIREYRHRFNVAIPLSG